MERVISLPQYDVRVGSGCIAGLEPFLRGGRYQQSLVLTDSNTAIHCLPRIEALFGSVERISIPAGEEHKHLETCKHVWQKLTELQAGRDALLINLGGGMVGDLGGFAAACYKRGITFIQVPTTLLAMVDASVGGKTGVNFQGFKNHLGSFQDPEAVFVDPDFLSTLPARERRSGLAEMLKHGLIADKAHWDSLANVGSDGQIQAEHIARSIEVKAQFVQEDPLEKGRRATLNFGHTIGHAIESASIMKGESPLLHGEAVAIGMICEAYISHRSGMISSIELQLATEGILQHFPGLKWPDLPADKMLEVMLQDKKNRNGRLQFALLEAIGEGQYGLEVEPKLILESFAYYQNLA